MKPYNDIVMEHFRNPRNVGVIESADGKAKEGSPACGDMVVLTIKVDKDTEIINDIKFRSYGCASNIATGSIITEMAKGKTLEEANAITWQQASEALGGLPKIKTHCSVLAVSALREAIKNYKERQGVVTEQEKTTLGLVKKRLKHVMNPMKGLDIVRTDLVEEIKVEGDDRKIITVAINLAETHQFSPALKEDILEKLEYRWDVDKVLITFKDEDAD